MPAFTKHWPDDPYAVARTGALNWLGDKYLLAQPINKRNYVKSGASGAACLVGSATKEISNAELHTETLPSNCGRGAGRT